LAIAMWDPWADARAAEELRGRLQWFLLGRVAVLSGFLGMVAALYLGFGQQSYGVSVQRLLFVVGSAYGFSLVSAILLRRTTRLAPFTYAQIIFDILLITGVMFLTGGHESPFAFLYALPIINGAGLLLARGALVSGLAAAGAYDVLLLGIGTGMVPAVSGSLAALTFDADAALRVASTNLTFLLIALLAGVLTRRIHEMERLLKEQQAERERLALLQSTLAQTIGSGLLTADADGRITSVDSMVEQLTGQTAVSLRGRDIGAVFPPLQLSPSARLRFLQSQAPLPAVEFHHQHDSHSAHLRCVAAPLTDTYGNRFGALYILQDVTRLKELEGQAAGNGVDELYREELEVAAEISETSDGLHGSSPPIRRVRQLIERVAQADATVLISGESGTGKELAARAIHSHSGRRDRPFVAVNCGAIPEHLIESELFGHVRGAFTGAVADRAGCFRMADTGSLFLDEIGELPLHLQVKLLRVLQERVFRPVGGETNVAVNVRIIAATNRDLAADVKSGRFREDLFYRLNVISITLPALRERREDIPLLVRHFLRQFSDLHERHVTRFSVSAGKRLLQYEYPGNIRELENIVEHAVTLCDGDMATEEHLPIYLVDGPSSRPLGTPTPTPPSRLVTTASSLVDLDRDLAEYEKAVLLRALSQAGGVKKRAAELLGINYRSLRHRLQKYGLAEAGDEASDA
jgi:two-component system response regulator PilR (NtrC family)